MEIIRQQSAIDITKPEGTRVQYYIFPEYELHYNEVPAGTVQAWHHHSLIEETLLMIQGHLEARWRDQGQEHRSEIGPGDVVRVENTPHTFANTSDEMAIFVIFRLILTGTDQHEVIKNDKYLDEQESLR